MIKLIATLLKVLNSDAAPGQISLAFCFSMIAGFTPILSLHNLFVLFLVLILRVNLSAFILGFAFFSTLAFALDPLFHQIGLSVLTTEALNGLWTSLYNHPLWQIERFNNSIVMGSLLSSLILFFPVLMISNRLILKYREHFLARVMKSKIMIGFKASKLYSTYQTVSGWTGGVR